MPGPTKHDYGDGLGTLTQGNYKFLKELWGAQTGPALKRRLTSFANEQDLRNDLKTNYGIQVANDVHVVIFDIETLTKKSIAANPENGKFYLLVLPPAPLTPGDDYQAMQAWAAAHYHAINESYGM